MDMHALFEGRNGKKTGSSWITEKAGRVSQEFMITLTEYILTIGRVPAKGLLLDCVIHCCEEHLGYEQLVNALNLGILWRFRKVEVADRSMLQTIRANRISETAHLQTYDVQTSTFCRKNGCFRGEPW